jgi:hypothetical protein
VVVAPAGDLVTTLRHLPHQLGSGVRHPAHDEEGGADFELVEEVQRVPGAALEPVLEAIPLPLLDEPVERTDLLIVLQRHREQMTPSRNGRRSRTPGPLRKKGPAFIARELPDGGESRHRRLPPGD